MISRIKIPAGALLAGGLFLTFLLYSPVLKSGFVYDDLWFLARNPAVRSLNIKAFFLDPKTAAAPESGLSGDVYRPFGTLAFALAFKGWGLNALPSHAVGLFLHLLNGVLVWRVLAKLLKDSASALFGTLVFLLHPAQVQNVAWISQFPGLMGCVGFLIALNYFVDPRQLTWTEVLVGWIAFAAAVLSKETVVILPLVAALLWDRRSRDKLYYGMGLGAISFIFVIVRYAALQHFSQFSENLFSCADSLSLGLLAFPVYLSKILIPVSLRVSYGYPFLPTVWLPAAAAVVLLYLMAVPWLGLKSTPARAMGWILIGLLPVLQIIPIRTFLAERFLYIPMMGVGWLAAWLWQRSKKLKVALLFWLLGLSAGTALTVPTWRSEQTLWAEAVAQEPSNAFAHACYGNSLGITPEAEREFVHALVNRPAENIRLAAYKNLAYLHHAWGHTWKANYWRKRAEG